MNWQQHNGGKEQMRPSRLPKRLRMIRHAMANPWYQFSKAFEKFAGAVAKAALAISLERENRGVGK